MNFDDQMRFLNEVPFYIWKQINFEDYFPSYLKDSKGKKLLHYAADRGSIKRTKYLVINSKTEISRKDNKQCTAYDYAAIYQH